MFPFHEMIKAQYSIALTGPWVFANVLSETSITKYCVIHNLFNEFFVFYSFTPAQKTLFFVHLRNLSRKDVAD